MSISTVPNQELLLNLDLQFNWEMPPLTSRDSGEGEYVGSGEGKASGIKINGIVRWDLFEKREGSICRSNMVGMIETNDNATIHFDSRGFFIQPNEKIPNIWIASSSLHFHTGDERYLWLNHRLAVWEGNFDMTTFRHHYRIYLYE